MLLYDHCIYLFLYQNGTKTLIITDSQFSSSRFNSLLIMLHVLNQYKIYKYIGKQIRDLS
jgi:hypothetical protein